MPLPVNALLRIKKAAYIIRSYRVDGGLLSQAEQATDFKEEMLRIALG